MIEFTIYYLFLRFNRSVTYIIRDTLTYNQKRRVFNRIETYNQRRRVFNRIETSKTPVFTPTGNSKFRPLLSTG